MDICFGVTVFEIGAEKVIGTSERRTAFPSKMYIFCMYISVMHGAAAEVTRLLAAGAEVNRGNPDR